MANKRNVALSIGVSDARSLPYLAAAVNGARSFGEWSKALGYETTVLVDDERALTIARLREELDRVLTAGPPIRRMILYFAGHGLIRGAEETLWLFSDWRTELRAVAAEVLKRRLRMWGVEQISIFSDSCRSLPADVNQDDLTPDGVLGQGPVPNAVMPPVDKFVATQDGSTTFAIPGRDPSLDRCLFTGVLLEGLWGLKRGAFSLRAGDLVTSNSLGTFLRSEVPSRAKSYRWNVVPNVWPTFPEGEDVYYGEEPKPRAPVFPDWPKPPPEPRTAPPLEFLGPGRPPAAAPVDFPSGGGGRGREVSSGFPVPSAAAQPPFAASSVPWVESRVAQAVREQNVPRSFETRAGFAVAGARVVTVWTGSGIVAGPSNRMEGWWHVGRRSGGSIPDPLELPAPVLIECDDGSFIAATALPGFVASLVCGPGGASGLVYRAIYSTDDEVERDVQVTARALGSLESGSLRADAKTDLALELRRGKHADPVLGAISAYLYDSVGDIDSIRRMAYFYTQHDQPIPYDLALLAQLEAEWQNDVLWAKVPKVAKRHPRTNAEARVHWTYEETQEAAGVVGGVWPWLKQGWFFLDDPVDTGLTVIRRGLPELIPHVQRGRFATLDREGGLRLASLFGLSADPRKT